MNHQTFVTRRSFLMASAAVGFSAAGVATLSACSSGDDDGPVGSANPTPREVGDATLKLSARPVAEPYKVPADAKTRKENAGEEAYSQALEEWLDANPGVKLEEVNTDVWNKDAMTTAIAGGTAPSIYWANVIGNWYTEGIRQAFAQGLAADVTELVAEHDLVNRLSAGARSIFEKSWAVDGRFYGAPKTYTAGEVVHFRRDLLAEADVPEPEPGWTWADLRELAEALTTNNVTGIMFRTGPMNGAVKTAEGMDFLSRLPAPDDVWHWKYDYSIFEDQWAQAAENIRAMRFEDKTAVGDIGMGDDPWQPRGAFTRGEVGMHINSVDMLTNNPTADDSPLLLAKKLNLPIDDVAGLIMLPAGIDQHAVPGSSEGFIQGVAFDPELGEDDLVAAFSLHMHMIGDGLIAVKEARYELEEDLTIIYQNDSITPVLAEIEGKLPGSAAEAWGEKFVASIEAVTSVPPKPAMEWYIPTEQNPGPGDEPLNDMLSKWWYEEAGPDVPANLQDLSDTRNEQAASFSSSVPGDEFIDGAKKYYDAHAKYWQEHSPDFYSEMFEPWYEEHVKPVIG